MFRSKESSTILHSFTYPYNSLPPSWICYSPQCLSENTWKWGWSPCLSLAGKLKTKHFFCVLSDEARWGKYRYVAFFFLCLKTSRLIKLKTLKGRKGMKGRILPVNCSDHYWKCVQTVLLILASPIVLPLSTTLPRGKSKVERHFTYLLEAFHVYKVLAVKW